MEASNVNDLKKDSLSSEIPIDSTASIQEIQCESKEKVEATPPEKDSGSVMSFLGFFRFFGAGFMAAVAFLDPGNLEADINVG